MKVHSHVMFDSFFEDFVFFSEIVLAIFFGLILMYLCGKFFPLFSVTVLAFLVALLHLLLVIIFPAVFPFCSSSTLRWIIFKVYIYTTIISFCLFMQVLIRFVSFWEGERHSDSKEIGDLNDKNGFIKHVNRFISFWEGERHSDAKETLEDFVEKNIGWEVNADHNVVFIPLRDDFPFVGFKYRIQRFGSCFIHAPILLSYYLLKFCLVDCEEIKVVDMVDFIRKTFNFQQLFKYFFLDSGGFAEEVLFSLLKKGSTTQICTNLFEDLKHHGVLFIESMKLYSGFFDKDNFSYHNLDLLEKAKGKKGNHSMIIVGRRLEGETEYFLLQNWWEGKQFVEVTSQYLTDCEAVVKFVVTDQDDRTVQNSFTTNNAIFTQAMNLDRSGCATATY